MPGLIYPILCVTFDVGVFRLCPVYCIPLLWKIFLVQFVTLSLFNFAVLDEERSLGHGEEGEEDAGEEADRDGGGAQGILLLYIIIIIIYHILLYHLIDWFYISRRLIYWFGNTPIDSLDLETWGWGEIVNVFSYEKWLMDFCFLVVHLQWGQNNFFRF